MLGGNPAAEMFNFKSPGFRKLGLERNKLNADELIDLMLKEPRFIRRPVVRLDGRVYFGADRATLQSLLG